MRTTNEEQNLPAAAAHPRNQTLERVRGVVCDGSSHMYGEEGWFDHIKSLTHVQTPLFGIPRLPRLFQLDEPARSSAL